MPECDDLPPLPPVLQADLDAARRALGLPGEAPAPALPPADWAPIEADLLQRPVRAAPQLWRVPPRVLTSEAALARIAALEAETARLRAGLATLRAFTHPIGHYNCARSDDCSCGAAMFNDRGNDMRERIDALLAGHP